VDGTYVRFTVWGSANKKITYTIMDIRKYDDIMQKLKAIITGNEIHDVGYRVMLINKALSHGVNNFNAFNTYLNGTQAVIAIIEADDETIEEFKNFVTNFYPKKSIVENISFEEYKNIVPPIERTMQAFQMEQWGKAIPVIVEMLGKLNNISQDTSEMKSSLTRMEIDMKDTRFSLSSFIEEKFKKQELEIEGIKITLARMQAAGEGTCCKV